MFKVVINDGKNELPDDDIYYIIAKGGIYLKKKVGILESIAPVNQISILEEIEPVAELNIRKIPAEKFAKILEFFKQVYSLKKSEACVLLHYNLNKKRYILQVPPQEVSYAGIDYIKNVLYDGYDLIGSVHSHGSMSAFHSSIDHMDEKHFDGLHITIGNVDKQFVSVSTSIMSNGHRFNTSSSKYIDGLELVEHTPWWPSMFKPGFKVVNGKKKYKKNVKSKLGYTVLASNEERKFDKRWLNFVKSKKYTRTYQVGTDYLKNLYKNLQIGTPNTTDVVMFEQGSETKDVKPEYNPCSDCLFRNFKVKLAMSDLIESKESKTGEVDLSPDFMGDFMG